MNKLYMLGNTHFDPVWLWTWDEGLSSIRSTLKAALDRMDEDEGFRYSFACAPVFEMLDSIEPELMQRIEKRVREGRWALDEGLWVQPDCATGGIESYIRQCLMGQLYLKKRFGKMSKTVFNIDSFGHPLMLCQVFSSCHMPNMVISRPDEKDMDVGDELFRWQSPDGSTMTVARVNLAGPIYPVDTKKAIEEALPKLDSVDHDLLLVYGVTNHGGAPTKRAIAEINEANSATGGRVVFSTADEFFDKQKEIDLPVWEKDIPIRHFGVFVNRPDFKKYERECETALMNAEKALFLSGNTGCKAELDRQWKNLLYCQFHDILGGAALNDSYRDAFAQLGEVRHEAQKLLHLQLQQMANDIEMTGSNAWNLVLWNLNTESYDDYIETEVQWAWEFDWYQGALMLTDDTGKEIPCQTVLPRSVIPGFRQRLVFRAEVPALGYKVYKVCQKELKTDSDTAVAMQRALTFAENQMQPVAVKDESDVWAFNFTGYGEEKAFAVSEKKTVQSGPIQAKTKMTAKYGESFIEETVCAHSDSEEIDLHFRVNWNEKHKALKLKVNSVEKLIAATPGLGLESSFDGMEKAMNGWLDVTLKDGKRYLILTDGCFGYEPCEDGSLRLTVLRSPIVGDLRISPLPEDDYEYMSQGIHEFNVRVIPHKGLNEAEKWARYDSFVNPPIVVCEANHKGTQPLSYSFVKKTGNVAVTAIKQAEADEQATIVRLTNYSDADQKTDIELKKLPRAEVTLKPYEIATYKFTDDGITKMDMLEC